MLVAVAVLAAGCDSGGHAATPTPDAPTTTGTFTQLPGSTPGGTHLRIGQQAVITVGPASNETRVGVIVTGIEAGTRQDLVALRAALPDKAPSLDGEVFFIRATLINIDGMPDAGGDYTGPQLVGVTATGQDADFLFGDAQVKLPHCTWTPVAPPSWMMVKGARRTVCLIDVASSGDPVTGARYDIGNKEPDIVWQ
jgi:hypothetical protein